MRKLLEKNIVLQNIMTRYAVGKAMVSQNRELQSDRSYYLCDETVRPAGSRAREKISISQRKLSTSLPPAYLQ